MNDQPCEYREIVEEHRFTDEIQAIEQDARKSDEFIDGAKWVLSREPRAGIRIGKGPVWFLPIAESPLVDAVVLYYTFDADHVYFLSIRKTIYPPKDEPSE
jgi:hypothetical protein